MADSTTSTESAPILPPGTPIVVRKLRPNGAERISYRGQVIRSDAAGLALHATFSFDDVSIGPATFQRGDEFVEFYDWSRWFVIAQISAPGGALKGWYCDVTMPPVLEPGSGPGAPPRLSYTDLALDLWRGADGTIVLMDEEEFAARRAAGEFTDDQVAGALRAWEELRTLAEAVRLPHWPP